MPRLPSRVLYPNDCESTPDAWVEELDEKYGLPFIAGEVQYYRYMLADSVDGRISARITTKSAKRPSQALGLGSFNHHYQKTVHESKTDESVAVMTDHASEDIRTPQEIESEAAAQDDHDRLTADLEGQDRPLSFDELEPDELHDIVEDARSNHH